MTAVHPTQAHRDLAAMLSRNIVALLPEAVRDMGPTITAQLTDDLLAVALPTEGEHLVTVTNGHTVATYPTHDDPELAAMAGLVTVLESHLADENDAAIWGRVLRWATERYQPTSAQPLLPRELDTRPRLLSPDDVAGMMEHPADAR